MIPLYTPEEMVRLELLCYDNPDGLHPVEANWRNLARKLMKHVEHADKETEKAYQKIPYKSDTEKKFKPFQFPIRFSATQSVNTNEE